MHLAHWIGQVMGAGLFLLACDDMVISDAAEDGLFMCRAAALRVIEGSGAIEFPSSFHDPFRDPTVVRLRYHVVNSGTTGTIRCWYDEDTDDRRFVRIEVDGVDVAEDRLQMLTTTAKSKAEQELS